MASDGKTEKQALLGQHFEWTPVFFFDYWEAEHLTSSQAEAVIIKHEGTITS